MNKFILHFLLLFVFVFCKGPSSESSGAIIKIDPSNTSQLRRSEIMTLKDIIRLEPSQSEVFKIISNGECLLIKTNELGLYDRQGGLIRTIGSQGKGPGEYLSLTDVTIQDSLIRVLDRTQHKMLDYDLNGVFLKEYPIGFFGQSFAMMEDRTAIYAGFERNENQQRLVLFDENMVQKGATLDFDDRHYLNLFDKTNFFSFGGDLRFLWAYDNAIYNVVHDKKGFRLQPHYLLDFGRHNIPDDFFDAGYGNIMEFELALNKTDFAGRIAGYYEDDQKLLFGFKFRGEYLLGIYSKASGRVQVVDSILDDIILVGSGLEIADEWFSFHFCQNQAYLAMDAWQLSERLSTLKESMSDRQWQDYLDANPMLADIFSDLDVNDGPVVFVFDM